MAIVGGIGGGQAVFDHAVEVEADGDRNSARASSGIAPVATQPGRSGTWAEKVLPTFSMTMAYCNAALSIRFSAAVAAAAVVERW